NLDMTSSSCVIFMGIPCRPRAFRRVAWGRASVRPVELRAGKRSSLPAACSEQADAHCGVRERKSPKDLSTFGVPRRGGRCLSERPNKRLCPLDLHVDAAADNAMLVNFNSHTDSASQLHRMTNHTTTPP